MAIILTFGGFFGAKFDILKPMAPDTRELDVLALMAEEASNKAIARSLAISVHTVKFHIASLLDNLDAQGRAEAVAQGARLGGD